MVKGSAGTLTMRLVRTKLLKREEPCTVVMPMAMAPRELPENDDDLRIEDDYGTTEPTGTITDCSNNVTKTHQHVTFVRTGGVNSHTVGPAGVTDIAEWTFPPKAPAPHIYHINPELLVANDKNTFKGFRKQFSGRFKRLVARKPETVPVIPPELKPQLKTIYVY